MGYLRLPSHDNPSKQVILTLVLSPAFEGSPSRVSLKVGQGWFLCFSPSPVALHSWQPAWSSCEGAPPIYPQPYTFHLSSVPEEAKKVLGL